MQKIIDKYILKHNIFQVGEKIIIAVSGGADSVTLLDLMLRAKKYNIAVAHFNHLTRGAESDEDEAFVKQLAEKYNIPFFSTQVDVKKLAKEIGLSFQNVARDVRYEFLRRTAQEFGATKIALAHHADDQAETILINLLRGSGLKGIAGMAPLDGDLARPLLAIIRQDIEEYIEQHQLAYRTDASNAETHYTRNRIRHEIMPLLQKYNPALSKTLEKTAEIFRSEENFLTQLVEKEFTKIAKSAEHKISFEIHVFSSLDIAIKRRMILKALAVLAETEKDFSFKHIEDILELFHAPSGITIHLPHGIHATTSYGIVQLEKASYQDKECPPFEMLLTIPGETLIAGVGVISAEYIEIDAAISNAFTVFIHPENITFPICVRSRLLGDVVYLLGGRGKIKIKELLIDLHIERKKRNAVPLIVDANNEILWVVGIRPGEKCRTSHSGKLLRLLFTPLQGE